MLKNIVLMLFLVTPAASAMIGKHGQPVAIFSGRNVYSPSILFDQEDRTFKMWYGGWQRNSDYPNDRIYYRVSRDGIRWSNPTTVLSPSQVLPNGNHVNDPSVVKVINGISGKPQYTMFYTLCIDPCKVNAHNQIWSSVSLDGLNWQYHKPLFTTKGAAVPSAITIGSGHRAVWRVYYSNTAESMNNPTNFFMADVDGNRVAVTKDLIVYSYNKPGVIANPEVRELAGAWGLFFNVYHTRSGAKRVTGDIYLAKSPSSRYWPSGSERALVLNDPDGPICATVAPGVVPVDESGVFLMQYGQALYSPGGECDFATFTTMRQTKGR